MGYTLQANRKTREGPQHPNQDAQFRYIHRRVKVFLRTADPVISVDTKKKGKGIPYGAYDIAGDRGVVSVGVTRDTAEFAVESIRRWWKLDGRKNYSMAQRLLICADAGGSNGTGVRAWKLNLQQLADQMGVPITVCHYPPGTSKWNKIEHRLFSFISLNWKGRPLVNYETIVNLIGATKTRSGLKVKAVLDTRHYETGAKVTASQYESIHLRRHKVHPDWNYTISPHHQRD